MVVLAALTAFVVVIVLTYDDTGGAATLAEVKQGVGVDAAMAKRDEEEEEEEGAVSSTTTSREREPAAAPRWLAPDVEEEREGGAAAGVKPGKPGKAPKPPKPPKPPPMPILAESDVFPTQALVNITDRDPRKGLRIALVGNGRGVVKHTKGEKIDAHDLVVGACSSS